VCLAHRQDRLEIMQTTIPPMAASSRPRPTPSVSSRRADEFRLLQRLWDFQLEYAAARGGDDPGMAYLAAHFRMGLTLERHLRVVDLLFPYIRGRVLEWGCRHGLDSCLYRHRLGEAVELYGCDVCDGDDYRPFHDFSGLSYHRLTHPYRLDYDDDSFDVVTSNGVLEHVPDDQHSLGEIARILRPGGAFLITCLPNRFSYTEAIQRQRGGEAHDRLYTLGRVRAMLRARGFVVTSVRRLFMVPTMLNGLPDAAKSTYQRAARLVWAANDVLERAWPLNLLASNLMIVAVKERSRSMPIGANDGRSATWRTS
jgi:SAM-dependent methyltransferase